MMNRLALFLAFTLLFVLAACSQPDNSGADDADPTRSESTDTQTSTPDATDSETASPDVEVEAGWQVHEGEGFSVALPEEWQVFDAETIADMGIFGELAEENPDLEAVFLQVEASLQSGQTAFIAMELGEPAQDGFAENVNIGESQYQGSLEDLEEQSVAEVEAGIPGVGDVDSEIVELGSHEALRLQYGYELDTANGSVDVEVIQYLVVADDSAWVVTYSSTGDRMDEYEATFEQSAETFTVED